DRAGPDHVRCRAEWRQCCPSARCHAYQSRPHRCTGRAIAFADALSVGLLCQSGRSDFVWLRSNQPVSAGSKLCGPYIARRQARRPACAVPDETSARHQSQDRQNTRPRYPGIVPAARRRGDRMKRRSFITLIGAAAAWPLAARAQGDRIQRIGILLPAVVDDAVFQARVEAFLQGLALLGWTTGRNVRIETRWAGSGAADVRRHAAELVALAPDVILAAGGSVVGSLTQASRTVPIVFATVGDPGAAGFIDTLARPGGNVTGFMTFEYSLSGKWLELLKEIAPDVKRVAVLRDATQGSGTTQFAVIQAMAPSLRVDVNPANVRDAREIEQSVETFARSPNGGLIITAGGAAQRHRDLIIKLAARYKLPAIYPNRGFLPGGGLISYGPDYVDQYRRAAGYVDRILKGEKPADLPVQAPTKYETVINLK